MQLFGRHPGRRLILYFAFTIIIGTMLLLIPASTSNRSIKLIDALFTATSAVCVTGLTVMDTGQDFTLLGQLIILVLIQLGGLGIMTFTTALFVSLGAQLSFRERLGFNQSLGGGIQINIRSLLKAIILITFIIEVIGTILLFFKFRNDFTPGKALFVAIFHSVSAFCNAGFSTFSTSLENFNNDLSMISIFSFLIIAGGLGFVVIRELCDGIKNKKFRLSLHTKLAVSVTVVLLVLGTGAFFIAEQKSSFSEMRFTHALANAFFQSVTCRTAGFYTTCQNNLTEASLLISIVLMFIGACPGSTGGGIKTTSIAVILFLAFSRFMGKSSITVFKRSITTDSIIRALTVFILAILVIAIASTALMFFEEQPLAHYQSKGWFVENLFEIFSAFGTVGLSLEVTSKLHAIGKIIIIICMFTGRVGLLTLAFALAKPPKKGEIVYSEESVMIG